MRIFVTGIGIFTSIGKNSTETLHSIETGHSGIGYAQYLKTNLKDYFAGSRNKTFQRRIGINGRG